MLGPSLKLFLGKAPVNCTLGVGKVTVSVGMGGEGSRDIAQKGVCGCGQEGACNIPLSCQPRGFILREVHVKSGCQCCI